MNKILMLGCSGGGKSTISNQLFNILNIPVLHLDIFYWKENWVATQTDEWREIVKDLLKKDQWIMDGTFSSTFDLRFPEADLIVVLKRPRLLCLYRAITRLLKYDKVKRRLDMAQGCEEKFDLDFYKYIWNFNKVHYPRIETAINQYECHDKLVLLETQKDIDLFLESLTV
ncbi:MAG: hypothetical protein KC646_05410 [Candidatus Cloacimonetes bacterium]|nr:hypothetical protein [Candidatus Cloacimonadota bacterium]